MNFTHLLSELSQFNKERIVFIGLGNELRGDDGAGLKFTKRLNSTEEFNNSNFIFAGTNPENYLQKIIELKPDAVIFIDAANWQVEPGEIKFLNSSEIGNSDFSTHAFSIKLIEKYIIANHLCKIFYIGIEPGSVSVRNNISEKVMAGIKKFFES
jgi:hydrogenase 3 maturation protease